MAISKLQNEVGSLLCQSFPHLTIKENYRPDWLRSSNHTNLELDFYIPQLKVAFEVQGRQHYEYTPHFHSSYEEFELRKQYDQEKKDLCYGQGINLIEIFTFTDAMVATKNLLENMDKPKEPTMYNETRKAVGDAKQEVIEMFRRDYERVKRKGNPIIGTPLARQQELGKFMYKVIRHRKIYKTDGFIYYEFKTFGARDYEELFPELLEYK